MKSMFVREVAFFGEHFRIFYQGLDKKAKLKVDWTINLLETVEHILKECPLHPVEREVLRKVSPELDLKILLDTKKGLDAVVKLLDSLPQLLC